MEKVNRFFWFCAGVHAQTLEKYPTEHNKYTGIGATIFFTGLFAGLSGGYAMYFVFKGSAIAGLFALLFGILWGLAIFNMDRYIVASINKNGSTNQQILQATPRILLAIMIGMVISRPLELKIFDKEIREKLKTSYLNGQRSKIDTLNKAFGNKYTIELTKQKDLKREKDSLDKDIKDSRVLFNEEMFGTKNNQTSGVMGYGPYAKRKEAEMKQKEDRLGTVRDDLKRMDDFINQRKSFDGLMTEKIFTTKELDSLANIAGFADRNWALGQLSFNADGTKDINTYLAITFIGMLFIFFECLPVFVKLMSNRGPYDIAVQHIEESSIHSSGKNRDYEVEVTDETHSTRVSAESDKQKHVIKGTALKDIRRFDNEE